MTTITKETLLDTVGYFTWMFGQEFFVETSIGNFVYSDPDYSGNDTLKKYKGSYADFLKETDMQFGRSKGKHLIRDYIGTEFTLVD